MDPTPKSAAGLLRGSGLDTASGPAFVQQRLALFGGIIAVVGTAFWVMDLVVFLALVRTPLVAILPALSYLGGPVAGAALWLICRRGGLGRATLERVDAAGLLACCVGWMLPQLWSVTLVDLIATTLAVTVTVSTRAILVPSKPARTLRLSALGFALVVAMVWWTRGDLVPPPGWPAGMSYSLMAGISVVKFGLVAVALATITSSIIYGLRQRVREANQLGQYTLEERMGHGGMGEVWSARHRLLMRPAAIKLIRLDPASRVDPAVMLRRFEREAHTTAALRSPHTVALYDFGQADDGTLYYVMEKLVGMDLESLVERFGPVPAARAVHNLKQACHSLDEAHRNGLTHRDIKPANIFVSRDGTELDFVKVLDFGLVRLRQDRPNAEQVKLTAEGTTSGTPAYMAPEIVMGDESYDHRVDLYAIGCVGYWLLTGKLVFEGDTAMKVMLDHMKTPPARPKSRTELPIPAELEQIILDCLEKDPARRPASAAELARRLAGVPLPEAWTAARAERWWSTHTPEHVRARPVADVLLSREGAADQGRPVREVRPRRFGPRAE